MARQCCLFCTDHNSQVGSNDLAEANASDAETAEDLRWLAGFASRLTPPVKIAYESWCFSERVQDWEHTWRIVQLAVRVASRLLWVLVTKAHSP